VPGFTALENFTLGGHGRVDIQRETRRLAETARQAGFEISPDTRADAMSPAEQQQLEILKALGRNVRILILDEPTAVLPPLQAEQLLQWLRAFTDHGGSVVLITHKLHEAVSIADDVTILRAGRTTLASRMSDVAEQELLAGMLGAQRVHDGPATPPAAARSNAQHVVIALHNVTAADLRTRERLVNVNLDVRSGEILGVAGLEGSGHRLLLRVLAGRCTPRSGFVDTPYLAAFIPEDRDREAIVPRLNLRDNVALRGAGARRGWISRRQWSSFTRRLLHEFRVHAPHDRVAAYMLSGGNQQRLVLARELADHPRFVVAENPSRGLDVQAASEVRARLRAARDQGAAVVLYSSDLDEIVAECDRVIVVHRGDVRPVAPQRDAIGRALLGAA
jgi:simple sugar transport system ATP-binding protein